MSHEDDIDVGKDEHIVEIERKIVIMATETRISDDIDDEKERIQGVDCVDCLMNSCRGAAAVAEIFGDELFYAELPRGRGILLESFQYLAAPAVCRHGFVRYR